MFSRAAGAMLTCCLAAAATMASMPAHGDSNLPGKTDFSAVLANLAATAPAALWYERREGVDPLDADGRGSRDSMHLVVQEDGPGGADVLTVRYPIDVDGIFRTFVGAGLGRAEYYEENDAATAAVPLALRDTHHALGAVAEVGSEWHASARLRVNASVRWADVAGSARVVRTDSGPVSAQPVVLALGLGYRFR